MSLQKYRADVAGDAQPNGAVPWYANWIGGPTLSLLRNCPTPDGPRTVYVRGEPDSWTSIPAAYEYRKKRYTGYLTQEDGQLVFRAPVKAADV